MERNFTSGFLVLIRKNIIDAFDQITSKFTFRSELKDEKVFFSYLNQLSVKLDKVVNTLESFPKIEMGGAGSISIQTMGKKTIEEIVKQLAELKQATQDNRLSFPRYQEVRGEVKMSNPPQFRDREILSAIQSLENAIKGLKFEVPRGVSEIKMPDFPKSMRFEEAKEVISSIKELQTAIKAIKQPEMQFPRLMNVNVVSAPPQKYPIPPTHINLNPLQGYAKSTAITVGTSATALPSTPLGYRKSLVAYNNSSTVTLYVGGSDVTTANGIPVPPLSYSPSFDAGGKLIVYGVTSSTADVRVLEMSNDDYTRGTPNI